jgi:pectate lyase
MSSHHTRVGYFLGALAALTLAACGSGASSSPGTEPSVATTTPWSGQSAAPAPGASGGSCGSGTRVSSAGDLRSALANARPGETIILAPGVYQGDFQATVSGTAATPITLCGPRSAVLQGDSIKSGYTFHLDHASYWRVEGFTVQGGQKGVIQVLNRRKIPGKQAQGPPIADPWFIRPA